MSPRRQQSRAQQGEYVAGIVRDILRPDPRRPAWSQESLADEIGVSQTAVCNWMNAVSVPRRPNLDKLLAVHRRAVCHHWDCEELVPVCAFADSYPDDLRAEATHALGIALSSRPVSSSAPCSSAGAHIDLHIRSTSLPHGVSAYTFVDAVDRPRVFVVLVSEALTATQQNEVAWHEVYAHVAKFRSAEATTASPIKVMPSPVQHHKICR